MDRSVVYVAAAGANFQTWPIDPDSDGMPGCVVRSSSRVVAQDVLTPQLFEHVGKRCGSTFDTRELDDLTAALLDDLLESSCVLFESPRRLLQVEVWSTPGEGSRSQ